ncbi:hypothetical protein [Streptomyces sp. NRRL B-24484]|uniref:hypothetical protein n=1 Tax=Streptomyces sp. NRRL B-24484 TaxID=1463833 RepID=UPI0004C0F0BA|nr:hypothetical protein [Streptomyces sp. NRRL B-24484]
MAVEEKRAWIMLLVTLCSYAAYVATVLGGAGSGPLTAAPYRAALLWSVGLAIAASVVLHIAVSIAAKEGGRQKDQRDREIHRFGDHVGQSFLAIGGVAVLVLAMARADHFWIANAAYLAFVLSALFGSAAKIDAYRRGFGPW